MCVPPEDILLTQQLGLESLPKQICKFGVSFKLESTQIVLPLATLSSTALVMGARIQMHWHRCMYCWAMLERAALLSAVPGRSTRTAPVSKARAGHLTLTVRMSGHH